VTTRTPCPEAGALQALLEGTLALGEVALLTAHLEGCARCGEGLQALVASNATWESLPRYLRPEPLLEEPALREALARMSAQPPPSHAPKRPGATS
jgi:hypothetical protein